jgi:hypothetical protein
MSLPKDYMEYKWRRHGMDHNLYPWTNLFERKKVTWPGGARVALWIVPALEYFPMDANEKPFKAPGHMAMPYPDYRHYTMRDYGNRLGIFRIMKALDEFGLKASVAVNARIAERYPFLIEEIVRRDWEVIAHGYDMNTLHYGRLDEAAEREQVEKSLSILRQASGQPVTGWLSPARSESKITLSLLAANDVDYVCDWVNDDMPYEIKTETGPIIAMPHSNEMDDRQILVNYGHSEALFEEQILDGFNCQYDESQKYGGRIMQLTLTPYVIGLPFRIKSLKAVLARIMDHDGIWSATGAEVLSEWKKQQ